jgi:hypothetical protein
MWRFGTAAHPWGAAQVISSESRRSTIPADRIELAVAVEETDHVLGLLKRLDRPVEQDPVKAAYPKRMLSLVVLIKGVHPPLPRVQRTIRPHIHVNGATTQHLSRPQ